MLQAPCSHLQNGSSSIHPSSLAGLVCAGHLSLPWWFFPIAKGPFQLFSFPAAVLAEEGPETESLIAPPRGTPKDSSVADCSKP